MNKTKKIDIRLDPELFIEIDSFATQARLSRSQVVERALLQFFGHEVVVAPLKQLRRRILSSKKNESKSS